MANIDTTHLDSGTDKIKLARPALKAMADWINGLIGGTDVLTTAEKNAIRGRIGITATGDAVATAADAEAARDALGVLSSAEVDSFAVKLTGGQTIDGIKTFSSSPVVPNAANANQAVNKGQMEATVAVAVASVGVTTAQVLAATASASVGAVGTYAMLWSTNATAVAAGDTKAGSNLRYAGFSPANDNPPGFTVGGADQSGSAVMRGNGGTPAGTWRAMGRDGSRIFNTGYGIVTQGGLTLWLRIS